jgi:hypothetical protein
MLCEWILAEMGASNIKYWSFDNYSTGHYRKMFYQFFFIVNTIWAPASSSIKPFQI